MAKTKKTKSSKAKLNSAAKRNLFVVGVLLVCVGILLFVVDYKKQKTTEFMQGVSQEVVTKESTNISPSEGCKLIDTNYVCDIKINNPSEEQLAWSSVITGIDGSSLASGGYGTVAPGASTIVQLTVPKAFCDSNPEGVGNILILDDEKSSNQAETKFTCAPASTVSETPIN